MPRCTPTANLTWAAATLKEDAITAAGKTIGYAALDGDLRKAGGKWLIVHEHTSEPLP